VVRLSSETAWPSKGELIGRRDSNSLRILMILGSVGVWM